MNACVEAQGIGSVRKQYIALSVPPALPRVFVALDECLESAERFDARPLVAAGYARIELPTWLVVSGSVKGRLAQDRPPPEHALSVRAPLVGQLRFLVGDCVREKRDVRVELSMGMRRQGLGPQRRLRRQRPVARKNPLGRLNTRSLPTADGKLMSPGH